MIIVAQGDATALPFPDDSIDCIVSSPPYNVGIDYTDYGDRLPWEWYIDIAVRAAEEMHRVLVPGGRVWLNVPPAIPFPAFFDPTEKKRPDRANVAAMWWSALQQSGLWYRDTVAWIQDSHDGACAWGSWLQPSEPNLRGGWESILLFYKKVWHRTPRPAWARWKAPRKELGGDWTDLCRNVWKMAPSRSKDSPAPFPLELPARAIRLSTWPQDVVLDPFGGSGTTAEAADILGRVGISLDVSETQTKATLDRLTNLFS